MNMIKRQVFLTGEHEVNILIPEKTCCGITATDNRGYYYLLSNGTGYSFFTDVFALAASLGKDELIYIPLEFMSADSYKNVFPGENHYQGLVIFNYITTKVKSKDIVGALKTKIFKEERLIRQTYYSEDYPNHWETRRRLTVKKIGKLLILSGEKLVFTSMAHDCAKLSEYGDNAKYNKYPPHMHYDEDENTAKSVGITFYYWHNGGNDNQ